MPSTIDHLRELYRHRELLVSLTFRQFHARYKQSVLGLGWAVFKPIATVSIFTVVFSVIAKFPSDGIPYPLFAFGALLPWTLFNTAVSAGVPSMVNQANLVAKIYLPREILPLSTIIAASVDFVIALAVFVPVMLYYGVDVTWNILWAVPILLITTLFTFGLVLFLSLANVWFRDVSHAMSFILQFWMYLTPIIYPLSMVPERYRLLYGLNPMVGLVEGFRDVVLKGTPPPLDLLGISTVMAVVTFWFGYKLFKEREYQFADVI